MTMWEDSQVEEEPMSPAQKAMLAALGIKGGARFGTRPLTSPRVVPSEAARNTVTNFRTGYRMPSASRGTSFIPPSQARNAVRPTSWKVSRTPLPGGSSGAIRAGAATKTLGNVGLALTAEDFISGIAGYPGVLDSASLLVPGGQGYSGEAPEDFMRNSLYNLTFGRDYHETLDRIAANDEAAGVDDIRRGMTAAGLDPANMFDMNEFRWNMQFNGVLDPSSINAYRQEFESRISRGEDFVSTREDIQSQMMAEAQEIIDYNNTPEYVRTMQAARQMRDEYTAQQIAAAQEWAAQQQQQSQQWTARQLAELERLARGSVSSINSTGAEYATSTANNWNSYGDTLTGLAGQVRNAGANSQYSINDSAAAALAELGQQGLDTQGVSDAVAAGIARNESINNAYGGMLDAFGTNGRGYGSQRSNIYDRITQAALAQSQDNRMRQQFAIESADFDRNNEILQAAREWEMAALNDAQQWELGMMDDLAQSQMRAANSSPSYIDPNEVAAASLQDPAVSDQAKRMIAEAAIRISNGENPYNVYEDFKGIDPAVEGFFSTYGTMYQTLGG